MSLDGLVALTLALASTITLTRLVRSCSIHLQGNLRLFILIVVLAVGEVLGLVVPVHGAAVVGQGVRALGTVRY